MDSQIENIVSKSIPLSERVQKGLKVIEDSRLHKKPVWGEGLTVLDEETVKLPLVKRKALAIKKVCLFLLMVYKALFRGTVTWRQHLPIVRLIQNVKKNYVKLLEFARISSRGPHRASMKHFRPTGSNMSPSTAPGTR